MTGEASNLNYDELLDRAKEGKNLPDNALSVIRQQLVTGEFETDPYTLIHILGKAGDRESLPVIEKYLDFGLTDPEDDGLTRRISLQVIGRMWAMPEAFNVAARKAFHDPSPYVRAAAATIIGFLGARNPTLKAASAKLLLQGFENRDQEEPELWESFHTGLLELLDVPFNEWPLATRELKEDDVRWDIIAEANRIAQEVI